MATLPEAPSKYSEHAKLPTSHPPRFDFIAKNIAVDKNNKKYRGRSSVNHLDKT